MRLSKITIENFRGIKRAEVKFDRDMTVLIGENNTGKTSILEALRYCLDTIKSDKTSNFSEFDFYRDENLQDLGNCEPICLTVSFQESEEHLWPENVTQVLGDVIVGSEYSEIKLRVIARYNPDTGKPDQSLSFLDDSGHELIAKTASLKELRLLRPFFFQTAIRAAKDQFHAQSTFWASFLTKGDVDEETQRTLEEELYKVNKKIVESHTTFRDVTEELKRISKIVAVGKTDTVSVDPAPVDFYKTLGYSVVKLLTESNAKIPIRNHGEGTQSLSVVLLFSAYLKTRLQYDVDEYAEPIIAIEEPEAHLHPNAVRSVWHLLCDLPGQKVVVTHSGDILSEVPVSNLRRLNRSRNTTYCKSIPDGLLPKDEMRKLNHHIRRNRGELLFARSWLLVEGETDVAVFSFCAELLGIELHQVGVRIVEYSQVGQNVFIKVADALGIRWFLVADGDCEGMRYARSARKHLNGRREKSHIQCLSQNNIEVLLCESGFGTPYVKRIDKQKAHFISLNPGSEGYWDQVCQFLKSKSKPAAALEALLLMRERHSKDNSAVPEEIKNILQVLSGKSS